MVGAATLPCIYALLLRRRARCYPSYQQTERDIHVRLEKEHHSRVLLGPSSHAKTHSLSTTRTWRLARMRGMIVESFAASSPPWTNHSKAFQPQEMDAMEETGHTTFASLPVELQMIIIRGLDREDLCRAALVSRAWSRMATDPRMLEEKQITRCTWDQLPKLMSPFKPSSYAQFLSWYFYGSNQFWSSYTRYVLVSSLSLSLPLSLSTHIHSFALSPSASLFCCGCTDSEPGSGEIKQRPSAAGTCSSPSVFGSTGTAYSSMHFLT